MGDAEKETEVRTEQAEIDAYKDGENAKDDGPTDDERKAYLKARYAGIKDEYKMLQLQQAEAEATKREDMKQRVAEAFSVNYRARKFMVRELRKLGEKIEDRFVQG